MATAEQMDSAAYAHQAVKLWQMGKRKQAVAQFLKAISMDSAWSDMLFETATDHGWSKPLIDAAHDLLQYIYAESVKSGDHPRITSDPARMGGAPTIRGMRMPVITIIRMLAGGATHNDVLNAYPFLEPEDIKEAVAFAAENPMLINPIV